MRASCACPVELASEHLIEELEALGISPIVTNCVVRGVYEGPDDKVAMALVELFEKEQDHEINVVGEREGKKEMLKVQHGKPREPRKHKKTRGRSHRHRR